MKEMREFKLAELCCTELPLTVQKLGSPYYQEIHRHEAVELVYIRHGAGWCAVNGIVCPMLTGDLYIIPVGLTHEYYGDPGLSYVNVLFNEEIFRDDEKELFRRFSVSGAEPPVKYTFGPQLRESLTRRLDELNEELRSSRPWHLQRARALFIDFLIFVLRNASQAPGVRAGSHQMHLGRVLGFINDHLGEKITLEQLAEVSGYAPDYLRKIFRRETGTGIMEYIRICRLERACLQLKNGGDPVEKIARALGFFDASYFAKIFRKHCAMTPAQFRRKARRESGVFVADTR